MQIVIEMFEILGGGLIEWGETIGAALQSMITSMWVTVTEGVAGLSVFAQVCLAFMGVSLGIGLTYWIISWLTSLGKN